MDNVGLVVGATAPDELDRIRSIVPDASLLIPGVGAQGGDLAHSLKGWQSEWYWTDQCIQRYKL